MSLKQLPPFSDLFLVPQMIEVGTSTSLDQKDNVLRVSMASQDGADEYERFLKSLPHVSHKRSGIQFTIKGKSTRSHQLLFWWPDGTRQGVVVYDEGYYALVDGSYADRSLATGQPVKYIELAPKEDFLSVLELHVTS